MGTGQAGPVGTKIGGRVDFGGEGQDARLPLDPLEQPSLCSFYTLMEMCHKVQ